MTTNKLPLEELSISQIYNGDKTAYEVPIYQRNYAWGNDEITTLIQDAYDAYLTGSEKTYFIGTLVTYPKGDGVFEVIDGQQRLTTINLVLAALGIPRKSKLTYRARKKSNSTIEALKSVTLSSEELKNSEYEIAIASGYDIALKEINRIFKDNVDKKNFIEYFVKKIHLIHYQVPRDIDLNHYFEIMNSRGEQLEKHEVLKAQLLSHLVNDHSATHVFNTVWEACSNMERYVQFGFSSEKRTLVFGNSWNEFIPKNFEELTKIEVLPEGNSRTEPCTINALIASTNKNETPAETQRQDRFNSVINFPNFLLHVLSVMLNSGVPLDDKRLLPTFGEKLKDKSDEDKTEFSKQFCFTLLRCRFLFDQYVIKRELGEDDWSLKKLVNYVDTFGGSEEQNKIVLILSMFHVSSPTHIYKNWLNAALLILYRQTTIDPTEYLGKLEGLAKAFLLDRYLAAKPIDFSEIIFKNSCVCRNSQGDCDQLNLQQLNQGTGVENFIFNYLDYLLFINKDISGKYKEGFRFTFRSSVEHYYPQNPRENLLKPLEQSDVDKFGNLCLISDSLNSSLSNLHPKDKREILKNSKSNESIKQKIMLSYEPWEVGQIDEHGKEMTKILLQ